MSENRQQDRVSEQKKKGVGEDRRRHMKMDKNERKGMSRQKAGRRGKVSSTTLGKKEIPKHK